MLASVSGSRKSEGIVPLQAPSGGFDTDHSATTFVTVSSVDK